MTTDLVMNALLMAPWPQQRVLVRSDQGAQYTSEEWRDFLADHNVEPSMSRRGNCHDNATAESFFSLLKTERIRRRLYPDRETARRDVFNYIEMFYNPARRHGNNGGLALMEFEKRYFEDLSGVSEIGSLPVYEYGRKITIPQPSSRSQCVTVCQINP